MAIQKDSHVSDLLPQALSLDTFYVLLAGTVAFLVVYAVGSSLSGHDPLASRLKHLQERRAGLRSEALSPRRRRQLSTLNGTNMIRWVVSHLHLLRGNQIGKMTALLEEAGFRSRDAIMVFIFFKALLPVVFGVASLAVAPIEWGHLVSLVTKPHLLMIPLGAVYGGMILPDLFVKHRRNSRRHAIRKGLPDVLDMMMVCAEAGLTLGASLDRVSRELRLAHPDLAEELAITAVEMGFLAQSRQALENMVERMNIEELRSMVNVLIQTEKYGTPVAQALRVLASEFRIQRMLRAENKAARLPALMTIPLIVFILPSLFVVILTPAILQAMDAW